MDEKDLNLGLISDPKLRQEIRDQLKLENELRGVKKMDKKTDEKTIIVVHEILEMIKDRYFIVANQSKDGTWFLNLKERKEK